MFVPFISTRLERRKGGGGGGKGGGGGGGSGGSGSGGGRGSSISSGGTTRGASTAGTGTKSVSNIPAGQPFSGRTEGGGTRGDVYGSRAYGSGYPGVSGRGTAGRGFPFFYWPLAFGAGGLGAGAYLHHSEYGRSNNSTRPGGAQISAAFSSNSQNTTYRILSDNSTVTSLIQSVVEKCGSSLSTTTITPSAYEGSDVDPPQPPQPEQVVQYYRASSVALALDGYNNTGAFSEDDSAPDTPLPSNIDTNLLNCMNTTIGEEVPLVDSAAIPTLAPGIHTSPLGLVGLAYVIWILSAMV